MATVHDGGGASRNCWIHGRDDPLISKSLNREARRFGLKVLEGSLIAHAVSADWLPAAIMSVANASAFAAKMAVERMAAATESNRARGARA
jgi:hypothetical protein